MEKESVFSAFFVKNLGGYSNSYISFNQAALTNVSSISKSPSSNNFKKDNISVNEAAVISSIGFGDQIGLVGEENSKGYYITPTTGWNWGKIHSNNGVDIANSCGTPVYAAAEGLIIETSSDGSWNKGYGNYIKIEHSNNTFTLYSHLERLEISNNTYVFQGDLIGYIGNSGNTHGPTGCHLHFEVRGAKNPLAK